MGALVVAGVVDEAEGRCVVGDAVAGDRLGLLDGAFVVGALEADGNGVEAPVVEEVGAAVVEASCCEEGAGSLSLDTRSSGSATTRATTTSEAARNINCRRVQRPSLGGGA